MSASTLPFPWNDFLHFQLQFQSTDDGRKTCPASLGREEALSVLVDDFDPDGEIRDSETLCSQFDNLCCNRAAKHRHRSFLNGQHATLQRTLRRGEVRSLLSGRGSMSEDHAERFAMRQLLVLVRQCVTEAEWQVLWMLAEGYSYDETAACCGLTVENLKSRACRIRGRIRESRVGRMIQAAL